jgi:hypothetical protein
VRYVILALTMLISQTSIADDAQIDRSLTLSASQAQVESFVRSHQYMFPVAPHIDWAGATIDVVSFKHGRWDGYVGVFFPESDGPGGGTVYYDFARLNPTSMHPIWCGYTRDISNTIHAFRIRAATGVVPP